MSASAARAVLRPSRFVFRRPAVRSSVRNQSSTSEAASNTAERAKEKASEATSKASEGLSKVQSSAGSAISKAGSAVSETAGAANAQAVTLVDRISSMIPRTVYYSKVAWELSKLVFQGQKMSPPSLAQFQSYLQPVIQSVRNPSSLVSQNPGVLSNPQQLLNQARNMSRQQMATVGIVAAEVIGFFTVGEMLGRFKIVGYRGGAHAAEHH